MAVQNFIRRKNIENLTKQLASGRLDEAQRRYAQQKPAEELAAQRALLQNGPQSGDDEPDLVPVASRIDGQAAPC